MIHLLAELIENATAFSPPNTRVQIAGQAVPHGYVIEVEDRGLGMSDEELILANERLANPPEIDFALSRVLGLYVVGRLSQRYGIKVQLRHSWYGGVTALALLPNSMLVWPKVPQMVAAEPAAAAGTAPGRAELPPPERPAEARLDEPVPDRPGDPTPIFEAARSDWFVSEPSEPGPLPQRQRQRAAGGDGDGFGRPVGRPPAPPPTTTAARRAATRAGLPAGAGGRGADPALPSRAWAAPGGPTAVPRPPEPAVNQTAGPPPVAEAPPPPAADPAAKVTQAGLPRRVPRANMAPGMVASQQPGGEPPPGPVSGRSPDEVRSMLSSYRTGIERGRTVAGGSDPGERPPETP